MMKRLTAPKFWPIERKQGKFIISPRTGPHSKKTCMPLGMILRDVFKYAANMKEAKAILNSGKIKVDGRVRKDYKFSVGLMDIVTIGDESFMILPSHRGFSFKKLKKNETHIKLLKIRNKVCNAGKIQLNFHDGTNMLVDSNKYKTNEVVLFDIEKKQIKEVLELKKGSTIIILSGKSIGAVGTVEKIIVTRSSQPNMVVVKTGEKKIAVPIGYVFVVGDEAPVIDLGE